MKIMKINKTRSSTHRKKRKQLIYIVLKARKSKTIREEIRLIYFEFYWNGTRLKRNKKLVKNKRKNEKKRKERLILNFCHNEN
jgi:uncharacterized protein (UPF0335 family)